MTKKQKGAKHPRGGERSSVYTISGHQIYSTVQNGATGTKLFNSTNAVAITPDSMGTQIASLANQYNQYRFTRLAIEYKPLNYGMICANDDFNSGVPNANSSNLFAFGYEEDAVLTFTVTHNSISQLRHNIIVPLQGYASRTQNILRVRDFGPKWYYTKDSTTNDATSRQTIQGTLYGEALTSITSSNQWGEIVVHYTIAFKDMCPTQGVTLSHLLRELSLGRSDSLLNLLTAVRHKLEYCQNDIKPTEQQMASYTNEEYLLITGEGRRVGDNQSVKVDSFDSFEIIKEIGHLASKLRH